MGYLAQGNINAFYIRLSEEDVREVNRLYFIGKKTKKKRIKRKLAKRVDALVPVSPRSQMSGRAF